jgi:hypothetical protein
MRWRQIQLSCKKLKQEIGMDWITLGRNNRTGLGTVQDKCSFAAIALGTD